MHCFTSVSFLIVSTSALSGVFGNPIDNPASAATNPILYRRGEKVELKYEHSVYSWEYNLKKKKDRRLLLCGERGIKGGPPLTKSLAEDIKTAQGVYFEADKQWYRMVSHPEKGLESGCFEAAVGPQTIFGNSLKPYTSVITQVYKNGTKLFIEDLFGVKLGENEHNGCVQVVDTSMGEEAIHLYIPAKDNEELFKGINKVMAIEKENCEIRDYEVN